MRKIAGDQKSSYKNWYWKLKNVWKFENASFGCIGSWFSMRFIYYLIRLFSSFPLSLIYYVEEGKNFKFLNFLLRQRR